MNKRECCHNSILYRYIIKKVKGIPNIEVFKSLKIHAPGKGGKSTLFLLTLWMSRFLLVEVAISGSKDADFGAVLVKLEMI